jgi:hypothetical protein
MTAVEGAAQFVQPGSRVLATWSHELAAHNPQRLWLARLLCHRIEALVVVPRPAQLDPFPLAVLRRLSALPPGDNPLETLHLDRALLARCLHYLSSPGLVQEAARRWQLTPSGQQALATGAYQRPDRERRLFYFVDNTALNRPPHFLPLPQQSAQPQPVDQAPPFDPAVLLACVQQAPEWKHRHGFPLDVAAIYQSPAPASDWRSVILDFPECLTLVFIQTSAGTEPELLAFPVSKEWKLDHERSLRWASGWEEVFPDLRQEPSADEWRAAWREWGQAHDLTADEVEACQVQAAGGRVVVRAPQQVAERLQSGPLGEKLKQEGWLLAGSGRCRMAGPIELFAAEPAV